MFSNEPTSIYLMSVPMLRSDYIQNTYNPQIYSKYKNTSITRIQKAEILFHLHINFIYNYDLKL